MEKYRAKILIVDDELSNLEIMCKTLEMEAYQAVSARSGAMALSLLQRQSFDLVLTDLRMPGLSGIDLLKSIRKNNSSLPVVILTAYGTIDDAVDAMKMGAVDFLMKPLRRDNLLKVVQDQLVRRREVNTLFLGTSSEINEIKRTIRLLAPTNAPILIEGESGTGKEIAAKCIHEESQRKGNLVSINCGAIPENLLESELFGYERGAFTGANATKNGLFEAADKGTLFLDEIGEMSLTLQVKLLRVLEDGVFLRLGSTTPRRADVRIIAATNSDVKEKIHLGLFREDLYYRLNVVSLKMPPLRERGADILLLAKHFLNQAAQQYHKKNLLLSEDAESALLSYCWPGNVRELKNLMERTAVIIDKEIIEAKNFGLTSSAPAAEVKRSSTAVKEPFFQFPIGTTLREMEMEVIKRTLEYTGNDKVEAARLLGINQRTVYRKIQELEAD